MDDAVIAAAVDAIDDGNVAVLRDLLDAHPGLVAERRAGYGEGYFAEPYLLWFVANNPIRVERMAGNIREIARVIGEAVKRNAPETAQEQLDYAVALVASGRVAREAGVQLDLIDELVDAGADPDAVVTALAHRETAAAQHLLGRGAPRSLLSAACLEDGAAIATLAGAASNEELGAALCGAAIYGNASTIAALLAHGADPNAYCPAGFHPHSTPLHQAVFSGSLGAVRALVDAGADCAVRDWAFESTPLGWAEHGDQREIAAYLRQAEIP